MKKLKPITVGEILVEEFMKPRNVHIDHLSNEANISEFDICEVLCGIKDIDERISKGFSIVFGNSEEFWLNLQENLKKDKEGKQ